MLIHLSDFMSTDGKEENFEIPVEMDSFQETGIDYPVLEKEVLSLKLANREGKVLFIEAEGRVRLELVCDRCLEAVPTDFPIHYTGEVDISNGVSGGDSEEDSFEEFAFIEDHILDTEKLVIQELLLHMPMKVLCDENCKGICNRCGANLNRGTCDCKDEPKDPRMAAILDLFQSASEQS